MPMEPKIEINVDSIYLKLSFEVEVHTTINNKDQFFNSGTQFSGGLKIPMNKVSKFTSEFNKLIATYKNEDHKPVASGGGGAQKNG